MRILPMAFAAAMVLSTSALAGEQAQGPFPGGWSGRHDITKQLNLDPVRAEKVQQIMADARVRMKAAHEQTMAALAQVLTPAELDQLKQSMPQRPMRPQ
jgi:Spy/CpxP family protein refolding chaperone